MADLPIKWPFIGLNHIIPLLLVGCAPAPAAVAAEEVVARPPHATAALVMHYRFDAGIDSRSQIVDDSGRGHRLRHRAIGVGAATVKHGGGLAIQFPARCEAGRCDRAVLETPDAADLDPGGRAFQFGASVRLTADQTARGSNVMQKGHYHSASVWKLQVDGRSGRPSCVLGASGRARKALSGVSVADGAWHALECRRTGVSLEILVDGTRRGQVEAPADLSISNGHPVRIGSNSLAPRNDQFHGLMDDVFLRVDGG